jgi:hypothetical protein
MLYLAGHLRILNPISQANNPMFAPRQHVHRSLPVSLPERGERPLASLELLSTAPRAFTIMSFSGSGYILPLVISKIHL